MRFLSSRTLPGQAYDSSQRMLSVDRGMLGGLSTNYPVFLVDYWVENVK